MTPALLALINSLIPLAANIVLLFKNSDGTSTAIISSAQQATQTDIQQMQAWLQQHQAGTPPAPKP